MKASLLRIPALANSVTIELLSEGSCCNHSTAFIAVFSSPCDVPYAIIRGTATLITKIAAEALLRASYVRSLPGEKVKWFAQYSVSGWVKSCMASSGDFMARIRCTSLKSLLTSCANSAMRRWGKLWGRIRAIFQPKGCSGLRENLWAKNLCSRTNCST